MANIKQFLRKIIGKNNDVRPAFGSSNAVAIDLSRTKLISEKSTDYLSSTDLLEKDLLPKLGFNNEKIFLFPKELYPYFGQGLLIWQYPNQFSKYLVHLSKFKIESYMEIGVRHGGTYVTTVEYLNKFNKIKRAVAVDINDCPSALEYGKHNKNSSFLKVDTTSQEFRDYVNNGAVFDLVLIDGDHSESGCRNDFEIVKNKANILVFHDIEPTAAPGVVKVWSDFKDSNQDKYDFVEFRDQYESVKGRWLGIGIASRKKFIS